MSSRVRMARAGFDGRPRTIIRTALGPPWSDAPHVRSDYGIYKLYM